jgi:hypothetical protein
MPCDLPQPGSPWNHAWLVLADHDVLDDLLHLGDVDQVHFLSFTRFS